MPASRAALTHWEATSFSTWEPCVSQLPKVISETLKPLFPRYLNSMGFTLTQMVAQGKGCLPLCGLPLDVGRSAAGPLAAEPFEEAPLTACAGPDNDTRDPVSSGGSGRGACVFLNDRGTRPGPWVSRADSTSGATCTTLSAGTWGSGRSRTD